MVGASVASAETEIIADAAAMSAEEIRPAPAAASRPAAEIDAVAVRVVVEPLVPPRPAVVIAVLRTVATPPVVASVGASAVTTVAAAIRALFALRVLGVAAVLRLAAIMRRAVHCRSETSVMASPGGGSLHCTGALYFHGWPLDALDFSVPDRRD
jgi:hypothetical protein